MGLQDFKIEFDDFNATYHPEQTITGRVILNIIKPTKIRSIHIRIKGGAHTSWNEGRRQIESDKEYFNDKIVLLEQPTEGNEIEIPIGSYTYPFKYELPKNIPGSFESEYGRIHYSVRGILERGWKVLSHETKKAFKVVPILDLNTFEEASVPLYNEKNETSGCFRIKSPLLVTYSIPVRGYVPGQIIPINVYVENRSGHTMGRLGFSVIKKITHKAEGNRKIKECVIAEVCKGPIGGNETVTYEQFLKVPPTPPSSLDNCRIINIDYIFKMKTHIHGISTINLRSEDRIYIGTLPVLDYQFPEPSSTSPETIENSSAPEDQPSSSKE